jgi:hypothetical protein
LTSTLLGVELEVDAVADGEDILIPESWNIWSGPASIPGTPYPFSTAYISERIRETIIDHTHRLARA